LPPQSGLVKSRVTELGRLAVNALRSKRPEFVKLREAKFDRSPVRPRSKERARSDRDPNVLFPNRERPDEEPKSRVTTSRPTAPPPGRVSDDVPGRLEPEDGLKLRCTKLARELPDPSGRERFGEFEPSPRLKLLGPRFDKALPPG